MKTSRLTAVHVHVIGIVVGLVIGLILFFGMIRPKNQDTETEKTAANAAETSGGTSQANTQSANELKKSKAQTKQIYADWLVYQHKYMPDLKWDKDPLAAFFINNPVNEIPAQWGHWVTNWYDAQRKYGVERGLGVEFPIPSLATDPNGIANLTSITVPSAKEPWKVTMNCRTFDDAMAHLRRFNGMEKHGMPVVDHVTLSGHSPELTMNYELALYVIPGEPPPPADSRIGGGTGGGGGGGFGGFGGGAPQMGAPGGGNSMRGKGGMGGM